MKKEEPKLTKVSIMFWEQLGDAPPVFRLEAAIDGRLHQWDGKKGKIGRILKMLSQDYSVTLPPVKWKLFENDEAGYGYHWPLPTVEGKPKFEYVTTIGGGMGQGWKDFTKQHFGQKVRITVEVLE